MGYQLIDAQGTDAGQFSLTDYAELHPRGPPPGGLLLLFGMRRSNGGARRGPLAFPDAFCC